MLTICMLLNAKGSSASTKVTMHVSHPVFFSSFAQMKATDMRRSRDDKDVTSVSHASNADEYTMEHTVTEAIDHSDVAKLFPPDM